MDYPSLLGVKGTALSCTEFSRGPSRVMNVADYEKVPWELFSSIFRLHILMPSHCLTLPSCNFFPELAHCQRRQGNPLSFQAGSFIFMVITWCILLHFFWTWASVSLSMMYAFYLPGSSVPALKAAMSLPTSMKLPWSWPEPMPLGSPGFKRPE